MKKNTFTHHQRVREEVKLEPKALTAEEENILKKAHDICEMKKDESKRLSEQWMKKKEIHEPIHLKSKDDRRRSRKESPESTQVLIKSAGETRRTKTVQQNQSAEST